MVSLRKSIRFARDPEARWREHGWGPPGRHAVERPNGVLVFSYRMPLDWSSADLALAPPEATADPRSVGHGMAVLCPELGEPATIAAVGTTLEVPATEQHGTIALWTVLYAALADGPDPRAEHPPGWEPATLGHPRLEGATRTREWETELYEGKPVAPVRAHDYRLWTKHGVLELSVRTPFFELVGAVLPKIAASCSLSAR
ncbi:MAG TPA: hypothetical protein VHX88_13550 [Solirubrobacteraceae bacterium]|jgi:hypothetical protein|nr:hypothetical protein [Solirubrobacteraceae bacterium]